ncbi:hypothetical protein [Halomarina litorea]|uniref:hypothetical protein n=1 Tax=Halomarina litorea TaxID=2961595 RepID=UPI0020C2716A|nr:hypothetical protein [Halomarina sp. BCD28]
MFDAPLSLYGAVALIGLVHGAEPGHGWPVAATYALNRSRTWSAGLVAGLVIGIGHLISSIAVVAVFFLAASYFDITQLGWVNYVAGAMLILLGIREYRHGHSHSHGHGGHSYDHDGEGDHEHAESGDYLTSVTAAPPGEGHTEGDHDHGDHEDSLGARLAARLPFVGRDHDHSHGHDHGPALSADDPRGLTGLASTAFVLGFVHEEEFEILGFCVGRTQNCLDLMLVYAFAVILALVSLTLLLIAGFDRYEDRVDRWAEHFPTLSAAVLILMGLGFIFGVL